jgi:ferritin-like metal-binding protein YciE
MTTNEPLRDRLITFIEDAYAMELQIAETLRRHIEQGATAPLEIQARMSQHLAETELQAKRMRQRLEAYGRDPSALKTTGGQIVGNLMGLMGAVRPDSLSRNLRDDYVTEHLEIAAYTLLIAAARAAGDDETIAAAEASLREEVVMAEFLLHHLPEGLFVALEHEGIGIPAAAHAEATEGPQLHVTFEPLKDVQDARASRKHGQG